MTDSAPSIARMLQRFEDCPEDREAIIDQLMNCLELARARTELKTLLREKPVMSTPKRHLGIMEFAVWPDNWRHRAYAALAQHLCDIRDFFQFAEQIGKQGFDYEQEAVKSVVHFYKDDPRCFQFVCEHAPSPRRLRLDNVPNSALTAIIKTFAHRAEAHPYLIPAALGACNGHYVNEATDALIKFHLDRQETQEVLERRVEGLSDRWDKPSRTIGILKTLAMAFPDLYGSRDSLLTTAHSARSPWTRGAALAVLAVHWPHDEAALMLLLKRAVADTEPWPRRIAVEQLALNFLPNEEIAEFILERGAVDPSSEVRRAVFRILGHWKSAYLTPSGSLKCRVERVQKFKNDRATPSILRRAKALLIDCFSNDPEKDIRLAAGDILQEHFRRGDHEVENLLNDADFKDAGMRDLIDKKNAIFEALEKLKQQFGS